MIPTNFESPLAKLNEDEKMRNIYMNDRYASMKRELSKPRKPGIFSKLKEKFSKRTK